MNKIEEFKKLVEIEPKLGELLKEAESIISKGSSTFCANAIWYGYPGYKPGFKPRLIKLVGWLSKKKELQSERTYDIAYQTIYNTLPDCRHKNLIC